MATIWRDRHVQYSGGPPPSGLHGWLVKLRGMITFNRRLIDYGNEEIEDARAYRMYRREKQSKRRSHAPFLHYHRRTRPWYQGDHHRLFGFLSGHRSRIHLGRAIREEVRAERDKERRRRRRRMEEEGLAIRMGAQGIAERPRTRSRSHHRSRRGIRVVDDAAAYVPEGVMQAYSTRSHGHHAMPMPAEPIGQAYSSRSHGHPADYAIPTEPIARTYSSSHGHHGDYVIPAEPVARTYSARSHGSRYRG